jgi:hypothetical protein
MIQPSGSGSFWGNEAVEVIEATEVVEDVEVNKLIDFNMSRIGKSHMKTGFFQL